MTALFQCHLFFFRDRVSVDPDGEADQLVRQFRENAERVSSLKRKKRQDMERQVKFACSPFVILCWGQVPAL